MTKLKSTFRNNRQKFLHKIKVKFYATEYLSITLNIINNHSLFLRREADPPTGVTPPYQGGGPGGGWL